MSEETERKTGKSPKGRNKGVAHWLGKHRPAKTKRKPSEAHEGPENPMHGKHVPEETGREMSEAPEHCRLCKHVL